MVNKKKIKISKIRFSNFTIKELNDLFVESKPTTLAQELYSVLLSLHSLQSTIKSLPSNIRISQIGNVSYPILVEEQIRLLEDIVSRYGSATPTTPKQ